MNPLSTLRPMPRSRLPFTPALRLAVFVAAIVASAAAAPRPARAEVYLAATKGLKCSACHTNHAGGGMRSDFGRVFASTHLAWKRLPEPPAKDGAAKTFQTFLRSGELGPVRIGSDLRAGSRTLFEAQSSNVDETFTLDEAELYLSGDLYADRVTLYLDERFAGGATNREAAAILHGLPWGTWFRVGNILPPYGLRLQDDTAFVRNTTGFSYSTSDLGFEVGTEPGPWSAALAVVNGAGGSLDTNDAKQVSGRAEYVKRRYRAGASIAHATGDTARQNTYGIFGGGSVGRFVFTGEIDSVEIEDTRNGRLSRKRPGFLETRYWFTKGQTVRFQWDFEDPDRDITEDARNRYTFGYEAFLLPGLHVRANAVINESIPQRPRENDDLFLVELHLFF